MKNYTINVNGANHTIRAARTSVAVKRVLDRFKESELGGAVITVGASEKIHFGYQVFADVPSDPPGSYKRESVSKTFDKKSDAQTEADILITFRNTHLDDPTSCRYVRVNRVEKKS